MLSENQEIRAQQYVRKHVKTLHAHHINSMVHYAIAQRLKIIDTFLYNSKRSILGDFIV